MSVCLSDLIVLLNCIGVFIVLLLLPTYSATEFVTVSFFRYFMKFPLLASLQRLTLVLMTKIVLLRIFRSSSLVQRLDSWPWSFSKFNQLNLSSLVSIREKFFIFYFLFQCMMYMQLHIIRQDGSDTAAEFELHCLELF